MKKLLLQTSKELFKWMDSMGFADGQITYVPKSYPCFIVWCEVDGETHEFVYPSDFFLTT